MKKKIKILNNSKELITNKKMTRLNSQIQKKLNEINSKYLPKCHSHGKGSRFHSYCQQCGELLESNQILYLPPPANEEKKDYIQPPPLELESKIFTNIIPNRDGIPEFSSLEHNGIIWIGFGAKQYALLDLLDETEIVKQVRKFMDSKRDEKPIRAFANNNWLIVWSNKRIVVEDLLAIVNGNKNQVPVAFAYEIANEEAEICPQPIASAIPINTIKTGEILHGLELTWLELESRNKHTIKRVTIGPEAAPEHEPKIIDHLNINLREMRGWPYLAYDHKRPDEMILVTANIEKTLHYYYQDEENHTRHYIINGENQDCNMTNLKWALRPYDEERGSLIIERLENYKIGSITITTINDLNEPSTYLAKFDLKSKKLLETERIQLDSGKICVGTVEISSRTGNKYNFHVNKDNKHIYLTSSMEKSKLEAQLALNNNMFVKTCKDGFIIFSQNSPQNKNTITKTLYILQENGYIASQGYNEDNESNCINTSDWTGLSKYISVTKNSTTIMLKPYKKEEYT